MKCEECGKDFETLREHWQDKQLVCEKCYEIIDEVIYYREFENE